jgi:hypothetical protein
MSEFKGKRGRYALSSTQLNKGTSLSLRERICRQLRRFYSHVSRLCISDLRKSRVLGSIPHIQKYRHWELQCRLVLHPYGPDLGLRPPPRRYNPSTEPDLTCLGPDRLSELDLMRVQTVQFELANSSFMASCRSLRQALNGANSQTEYAHMAYYFLWQCGVVITGPLTNRINFCDPMRIW